MTMPRDAATHRRSAEPTALSPGLLLNLKPAATAINRYLHVHLTPFRTEMRRSDRQGDVVVMRQS